ncbi:F-box/LRR-repeat protein 17-like [Ylistrum balloti]|uniref:F-box/LRR-repeat protein 17-like n=1 Tax=Ylistrum balloti TaxID=509963 RepID=UPI002905E1A1|nr:F-box/LRR-repeat protein 17-like [Ylistrum balloti]
MASDQQDPTRMQTDNKSDILSENQSEGSLLCDATKSNQSEGCLYDDRTSIDQLEEHCPEERFTNPCKRKRVPSTEYLDAIDKTEDINNYFESLPKTESIKNHTCANLLKTRSLGVEGSSLVQGSSSSERPRSFERGHGHECNLTRYSCPRTDKSDNSGFDSEICVTEHVTVSTASQCVSSQISSYGDDETGETLCPIRSKGESPPIVNNSSHQGVYSDIDSTSTSNHNDNKFHCGTDHLCLSGTGNSVLTSSSIRKPFSISTATSSSASKPDLMSNSGEISKPLQETEALFSSPNSSTPSPNSSTSSPKQTFSISVMSSTSSTSQRPVFPRGFPQPEVVSQPMRGFPGVIVNTYNFEIPMNKETTNMSCRSKTCEDDGATDSTVHFNIPSYLLIQIFQHLSMYDLLHNVSSVCKLWYTISHDPDLWRVIDLRNQVKVTDVVMKNLTSYSDRVIYLNISDIVTISEDCLVSTVTTCKHLKTLKLSRCIAVTSDKVLTAIGENCHNLRNIHLEVCYRITDKGLEALAAGCRKLEGVHISQCEDVGNEGLAGLAEYCPLLRRLSVDSCAKVQDEGIIALANGCPELRLVNLHSSSIGDAGAYHLQKLKFLQTLDLSASNELSLQTVCAIARHCTQLECLNLSLNRNVDDGCVEMVAMHCSHLRKLYCVSCNITDTGLEYLGRYGQRLEHLDLGWCPSVTDAGVRFVSANCPALRYIGLIRCDQVTSDGIEDLVDKYPHINYSTFILESRKIIEMARMQGFQFPSSDENETKFPVLVHK